MLRIVKGRCGCGYNITLTQGDTASLNLQLYDTVRHRNVKLEKGDTAILAIKKNINSKDILLQVECNKEQSFILTPDDTINLQCGDYWYDVKFITASGSVFTVTDPAIFKIVKGVS